MNFSLKVCIHEKNQLSHNITCDSILVSKINENIIVLSNFSQQLSSDIGIIIEQQLAQHNINHLQQINDYFNSFSIISIYQSNQTYQIKILTDHFNQIPLILVYQDASFILTTQQQFSNQQQLVKFTKPGFYQFELFIKQDKLIVQKQKLFKYKNNYNIIYNNMNNYQVEQLSNVLNQQLQIYFTNIIQSMVSLNKNAYILLLFSGGVDSVLLFVNLLKVAQTLNIKFKVINISFDSSQIGATDEKHNYNEIFDNFCQDKNVSQQILKQYQDSKLFQQYFAVVQRNTVIQTLNDIKQIIFPTDTTIMNVNLTLVQYFSIKQFDNNAIVISGLGPDEWFCGYKKFSNSIYGQQDTELKRKNYQNQVMQQLNLLNKRNIRREQRLIEFSQKQLIYPYLSYQICRIFNAYNEQINDFSVNKQIIRKALENLDVSKEFCDREKKAAQFGSGVSKILKQNGYDQI